ncbi:hypothetical protein QL285_042695 [Trifolium repens]|nr:hypothetical protein QL285_042695 [Trifolium repens]
MTSPPPITLQDLAQSLQQIITTQQDFRHDLTAITTEIGLLQNRIPTEALPPPPPPHGFANTSIKLEIPRFDGSEALGWIFKINQFFDFHRTPEDQRLNIASFYMEGEALTWYQWMHSNGSLHSWQAFLHALELRFAPSQFDDPKGALFKLCQTSSVKDYQKAFEALANRITELPPQFYLSCFISGLRADIRREVMAFQPASLSQAIHLARLQEDKINDKSHQPSYRRPDPTASTSRPPPRPIPNTPPPTLTTNNTPPPTQPRPTPIRRLNPAELQARRDQGLCYNCDERFQPGHRCRRLFHILIAYPHTPEEHTETLTAQLLQTQPDPTPDPEIPSPTTETYPQISLHALMGHTIPQTIRLLGHIDHQPLTILIDSGSTHNFVQDRVAKQLGLTLEPTQSFQVLVGNGEELNCSHMSHQTPLFIDSHLFLVDLFVLPLSGAEIVLGVQWLRTLGPILTDYTNLTLSFCREGKIIQLMGRPKPLPEEASLHQFKRLVATDAIDTVLHFQLTPTQPNSPTAQNHSPAITNLIKQFATLFVEPQSLPPPRHTDHHIPISTNSDPINIRPYRYPQFQKHEIEQQIQHMLSQGIIQSSSSAFSSPVLLVRKKDGSWRFCVDYRALNSITVKDRFPIPTIDELLDELYGTCWYSKLDLRSGCHQIRMAAQDVHKTAFRTHLGHYEFLVMPFGLCNAPSTFQNTMNSLFHQYLRRFVIVFFDDILVYSKTWEDHLQHLEIVFNCLLQNQFFLKDSKCTFAQESISYLGHIVSVDGVGPDPEKIRAMVEWSAPTNLKQLRGFLGLTGFYRKFVKNYAAIASPLTDLLKKDAFTWSDSAQQAFDALKDAMTKAPVLALPNFEDDFTIETDASGTGMGAVLCQAGHPICYYSRKFCPKMQRSSTYVRELCAITSAVKKWRAYLLGRKFVILTDQRSLRELMTQIIQTPEQQFYLAKLLGYSYEIIYKPGAQNRVADALSRVHEAAPHCLTITIPHWDFIQELKRSLQADVTIQELMTSIQASPSSYPDYKVCQDLIFFKGKLFIPATSPMKQLLLEEFHSSPIGGHSGIQKTLGRLKENVYWEKMKDDVTTFVNACTICQETKHPTHLPYGLLQPLPIPAGVWEDISLDFIVGLPSFHSHTVILVVVDRFSKAAHFGMLPTHHTASKVADLFAKMVFKLHGMPKSIVSDRDPIFISKFWQQLFKLSGTKLRMSTAYHPQTDGQTEIVNKALQQYLRCFVHNAPRTWGDYLHWAEWHYNTSIHSSTGITPFEVVYGRKPPSLPRYLSGTTELEALDTILTDREDILQLLKNKLLKPQNSMKKFADKSRLAHPFKENDFVFVKLRPHRQISVAGRRIKKLSKRYYGPFKIIKALGPVAFELSLPPDSKIHPVFHVSQLKPCNTATIQPLALPPIAEDNHPIVQPLAILGWRHGDDPNQQQVLVQWAGLLPEDTSWENLQELRDTFPNLNLEDKVFVEEEGNVMNTPPRDSSDEEHWANEYEDEEEQVAQVSMGRTKRTKSRPKYLNDFI